MRGASVLRVVPLVPDCILRVLKFNLDAPVLLINLVPDSRPAGSPRLLAAPGGAGRPGPAAGRPGFCACSYWEMVLVPVPVLVRF
eukprot:SAG31_NODE_1748_length_7363_cov_288.231553_8_plen_85_part_00